jgi:hypothetical protein
MFILNQICIFFHMYLETEVMTSSIFFSQKHTYILVYLQRANFSEQIL